MIKEETTQEMKKMKENEENKNKKKEYEQQRKEQKEVRREKITSKGQIQTSFSKGESQYVIPEGKNPTISQ